ncbi:divalent metal cation transporter [Candidatus Marsarchaeota archaeon]|nr:divalent metal cation transporter [Candidatus Marsarchaeota archaeon]
MENAPFDINKKLEELPIEIRLRAIDRLKVARLRHNRGWLSKLLLIIALIGPGILVMVADNDAGGVITYAQTGSIFGLGFFIPLMILMVPTAYLVQEMTVRLAAVTRRGHAEMIWKRYGPFWGAFSLGDLVIANSLTLVTEFIGITFGMSIFGVKSYIAALIGIAFITTVMLTLRYHKWERASLIIAFFNMIFIPLVFFAHPDWGLVAKTFLTWNINGGISTLFIYVLLANIGTTIAPWMLFFQQSSEVDKGTVPEDIGAGKRDTFIGACIMATVAICIIVLTGTVVFGTGHVGSISTTSYNIAYILKAISQRIGTVPVELFALGLIDAGIIAAIALTASTSWAVGEAFNWPKSINLPFLEGRKFYIPGLISMLIAASIVMIPNVPLGFLNLTVQVIASIFMPAALLFLLLLVNDKEVMGKRVNNKWENASIITIMAVLITMSSLYGLSLVFPHLF